MECKLVGIGGIGVSNKLGEIVKTMALGSCVGVIMLARRQKMVGVAHVALPDSSISPNRTKEFPGYFADSAIPFLLGEFEKHGIVKRSDLTVKLAGGASIMDPKGIFNIGKRNVLAVRKNLWKHRLGALVEDIGRNYSRTVWVEVNTGRVFISSPGKGKWEI